MNSEPAFQEPHSYLDNLDPAQSSICVGNQQSTSRTDSHSRPLCQYCGRIGHEEFKCWDRQRDLMNSSNGNNSTSEIDEFPFCQYCGRVGHEEFECWKLHGYPMNGPPTCEYCGRVGHLRRNCRDRIRDNQMEDGNEDYEHESYNRDDLRGRIQDLEDELQELRLQRNGDIGSSNQASSSQVQSSPRRHNRY